MKFNINYIMQIRNSLLQGPMIRYVVVTSALQGLIEVENEFLCF